MRGKDQFTLYPSWNVPLGFDKFYPGDVTGMIVSFWADTGEVYAMSPMVFSKEMAIPTAERISVQGLEQNQFTLSPLFAITAVFSAFGMVIGIRQKGTTTASRRKIFKVCVATLCGLIFFGTIFSAVPRASAHPTTVTSRSEIYAALGSQPAQDQEEQEGAYWVCDQIADYFDDAGYSTSDRCGDDTTRSNVLADIQSDQENYVRTAVFHFGHQGGVNISGEMHLGYQDDVANVITADPDILS
jgi:hypothetical protein